MELKGRYGDAKRNTPKVYYRSDSYLYGNNERRLIRPAPYQFSSAPNTLT